MRVNNINQLVYNSIKIEIKQLSFGDNDSAIMINSFMSVNNNFTLNDWMIIYIDLNFTHMLLDDNFILDN